MRSAQGRDEAQATVQRITSELAELAEPAAADAEKLQQRPVGAAPHAGQG